MPRMIDADALLEDIGEEPMNWTNSPEEIQEYIDWKRTVAIINNAPTIDDLEKRNEPLSPEIETLNDIDILYRCPACHKHLFYRMQKYCCICGQAVKWE